MKNYFEKIDSITNELNSLLSNISNDEINEYIRLIIQSREIFFVGVGRVRLSLEATVKRFTHLGLTCHMVGDLNEPPITAEDILVVGSSSGESIIPLEITKKAQKYGAKIVHLTSRTESSIAKLADLVIKFESPSKYSIDYHSIQPMTSLFEQGLLIFHDVLALELMVESEQTFEDLKARHANLE